MTDHRSDESSISIRLEEDGPTTRIAVEIPISFYKALRIIKMRTDRSQSEMVVEALHAFLEKEAGTTKPEKGEVRV